MEILKNSCYNHNINYSQTIDNLYITYAVINGKNLNWNYYLT